MKFGTHASKQEGFGFESSLGSSCGFSLGTLVCPTVQKRAWVRLIGDYNLTMSVKGCLSVSAGPDWRFKTQTLDRLPIWSLGQAHTHRQPFTHIYISNLIHTRQSSLSFAL